MDLDQADYPDWPSLKKYCWHAAGVVGELSAGVFGYTQEATLAYAEKLGIAFQLTNIIRDVGDDARRGRIYLPVDELEQFGVAPADIVNRQHSERFVELIDRKSTRLKSSH